MIADPQWRDLAAYTLCTGIAVLVLFITVDFSRSLTVHHCIRGPAFCNAFWLRCGSAAWSFSHAGWGVSRGHPTALASSHAIDDF